MEHSALFRFLRGVGGFASRQRRRLGQALLESPLHPLFLKVRGTPDVTLRYRAWREKAAQAPDRGGEGAWWQPTIAILMPVHNPRREWLEKPETLWIEIPATSLRQIS